MNHASQAELDSSLQLIVSTINRCEKMQNKFTEGMSQHTLLKNRIKALKISVILIEDKLVEDKKTGKHSFAPYTEADLRKALPPITSIIHKTERAQSKYDRENPHFKKYLPLLRSMYIAKELIEKEVIEKEIIEKELS